LGDINAGTISGVIITGGTFQTSSIGKHLRITTEGMTLHSGATVGKYSSFKYGDGTKYGSGALAFIHHSTQLVPFYISAEQTVADMHFYNRSSNPSGVAEIGDLCVVGGILKICTTASTPGVWSVVASQVA